MTRTLPTTNKFYEGAGGMGMAMLVLIEQYILAHTNSQQALLTCNFARTQILRTPLPHATANCAHTPLEFILNYQEIAGLCPTLCTDADLLLTILQLLDRLPNKFGSEIKRLIQIYKSNR